MPSSEGLRLKLSQWSKSDVVPVARLEGFRALKSSSLEAFRALKSSNLEALRALKPYYQIGGF